MSFVSIDIDVDLYRALDSAAKEDKYDSAHELIVCLLRNYLKGKERAALHLNGNPILDEMPEVAASTK
jgi:metal-responsive CopG/Arc/MetJ family transcriptional regulator